MQTEIINQIKAGNTVLGIELGSTRIKAVLIGIDKKPVASGSFEWENKLVDGIWTYSMDDVWEGIAHCYTDLLSDVKVKYNLPLTRVASIGISGMMHGYLVFDKNDNLLVPFRTWRNNITQEASSELTKLLNYPIPQRWSIAHLYQSMLNKELHINDIGYMTTLAGYVHWRLTGRKVLGIGDASGMFPVDSKEKIFNSSMIEKFDNYIASLGYGMSLKDILPEVLVAGSSGGLLGKEGALLIDPSGNLLSGIPLCPPEGDAGTGMVATNSVKIRTGNVSAGTSVFAMLVLEKELKDLHSEIDLVTTPDGSPVAMVHSNNCTSDYDSWISLFGQAAAVMGADFSASELYEKLLGLALKGDPDCGGLLSYGYISGEHLTGFSEGRPLFARSSHSSFTLENFMRTHLFSSLCALRTGLNVLTETENIKVDMINGHGGFFKTSEVGLKIMAAALNTPVAVLDSAGEGGAWGIALLASYMSREYDKQSLPDFLEEIFSKSRTESVVPDPLDVEGFLEFYDRYMKGLSIEHAAVENLN